MTGKVKYPPNLSSNDSYVLARHIGQIFQQEFTKQLGQHGSNGELSRIVIDDIQISRREQKDDKSRKQPVFNFIRSNQNVNLS
jgi:hypothetical protein